MKLIEIVGFEYWTSIIALLLAYWRFIVRVCFIVVVIAAVSMFLKPNTFKAETIILPTAGGGTSKTLSMIRSIMPVAGLLNSIDEGSSILFPTMLKSDYIMGKLLDRRFTFPDNGKIVTKSLQEVMLTKSRSGAIKDLRQALNVALNIEDGTISISYTSESPELAADVVNAAVEELDIYNRTQRKTNNTEAGRYLDGRLGSAYKELAQADSNLARFREKNKGWSSGNISPDLKITADQLEREADLKKQSYSYLAQQKEMTAIEIHKDLPVVSVIGQAIVPDLKAGPMRVRSILMIGFVTFFLVCVLLVAWFRMGFQEYSNEASKELRPIWAKFLRELRDELRFSRR